MAGFREIIGQEKIVEHFRNAIRYDKISHAYILNGEQGAKRNAVLLNAGAGLYIGGKADTFREGVELAASLIDGGQAKQKLEDFIKESNK